MPADIRNFFGGKPSATPAAKEEKKAPAKKGRARKVVDDSEDEEDSEEDDDENSSSVSVSAWICQLLLPNRLTSPARKRAASPTVEETTTAAYFATKNKPKRTAAATKSHPATKKSPAKSIKSEDAPPPSTDDLNAEDFPDDDLDEVFSEEYKKEAQPSVTKEAQPPIKKEAPPVEDDDMPPKKRGAAVTKSKVKDENYDDVDVEMQDDDDFVVPDDEELNPTKAKAKAKTGAKRKSKDLDTDEEEKPKPKKARAPAKKKEKDPPVEDSAALKAILDDIPLIEAPEPPPKDPDAAPKKWFNRPAADASAPNAGSIDIPEGADNCLAGLSFVFTGQLTYISRDEGQNLVKRYGGKCMTAPSKNTSYVVLGAEAGPKKLEVIKLHNLKVIDEKGLFALISKLPPNGGDSAAGAKYEAQQKKEAEKIKKAAEEMEKADRERIERERLAKGPAATPKGFAADGTDNRLWTVKYAPTSLGQICGNKGLVDKLAAWLRDYQKNLKKGFKLLGKDGTGCHRAVMIHGPPGIGKTTAAHLVAKLEGYDIVESNASDTRSKKMVEASLKGNLDTTSLNGYFSTGKVETGKKRVVLIMDEVDGMSAGDRGGVGALAAVCKKTQVPMILICNDRRLPKMKPFDGVTFDMPFRRPTNDMIRARIATIAHREGLKMPPNVMNALIEGTGADIRQVVNMISTVRLDQSAMDFNKGKQMSKAWEKHVVLKPWDITSKILGGGMFQASSKSTLNDKIELYFNDHEFSPLMLQENYLGTKPSLAADIHDARKANLKTLELSSQAADSISDGDLVDRMIHGSQQQWSLMPSHAIMSFVRPASFVAGSQAGNQTRFTAWLGKNSSYGKLSRQVKEIQGHMRLRTSGDRHEIRQQYLPILWQSLVKKLDVEGKEAVPEVIQLMDQYFLTKDDFDAILELGVGPMDQEGIKLETQTKATFTRMYNAQSHPLPFMKASSVVNPSKKIAKDKPDLEEAMDDSEDEAILKDAAEDDGAEEEEDIDISKDKYVAKPKKKKAAAALKGKGKKKAVDDDDDEEAEEEKPKPKKRAPAKPKANK
ncbi:DNA replication factor C, large subunit [Aureobasidium subglaciale]|nr:DNA replication factor C, large subunit [Aureobasidium subglaciale]